MRSSLLIQSNGAVVPGELANLAVGDPNPYSCVSIAVVSMVLCRRGGWRFSSLPTSLLLDNDGLINLLAKVSRLAVAARVRADGTKLAV